MASLTEVKAFFGIETTREFKSEWEVLTDNDRDEIRRLIAEEN